MSVQSAAIKVLKEAGKPLHAKEIAERMMAADLWHSKGKTPAATVSARLYSEIKQKGDKSAFVKAGPQTFALRDFFQKMKDDLAVLPTADQVQKSSSPKTGFSFTDCVQKVLEEFGGKKPMYYKKITEKALGKGWLVTRAEKGGQGTGTYIDIQVRSFTH